MIFFDLDDTLFDHQTAANRAARQFFNQYSHLLSYSQVEFVATWYRLAEKYVDMYLRGEIGWEEQRRSRMREVFKPFESSLSNDDLDARFADYSKAYEDNWVLFLDALPCLEALSDRTLGIITNGAVLQQSRKLSQLEIRDRFKIVVISEQVGVSKPDAHIFSEACRLAGVRPQDCVYVGDRLETDAQASTAMGMRAVWLNRNGDLAHAVPDGIEVIRSLSELPRLVQANT